ncbi:MAG: SDR family NAD(P)-dependent oxidoreductase [Pirellulaceae bacterium]|jgi:short-subunit dehydrogenase|nr:SDR family NAD(P)-dependent oxidoreductase [Pirellulaceae bacterium]
MGRRDLQHARVLVTGASSGIGRELVRALVRCDAAVWATARRTQRLEALAAELTGHAHPVLQAAGDITAADFRADLCRRVDQTWGALDVLINNAGVGAIGPFAAADAARLRQVMEVNFFAPAEWMRAALPLLRRGRQPLIVNIGSVLGHCAVGLKSEYCASKFALRGLSDALRIELAREGIAVLLVSPSTTQSEFFDSLVASDIPRPRALGRPMPADRVAAQVLAAMRRGRREIVLSGGGRLLVWLQRLAPTLLSRLLVRWG